MIWKNIISLKITKKCTFKTKFFLAVFFNQHHLVLRNYDDVINFSLNTDELETIIICQTKSKFNFRKKHLKII